MSRGVVPIHTNRLPQGVVRGWFLIESGAAIAGIFEVMQGGAFMTSYRVFGEKKPRVERHPSYQMAHDHLTRSLIDVKVVPHHLINEGSGRAL